MRVNPLVLLYLLFVLNACKSNTLPINSADCAREINTEFEEKFKSIFSDKYESIKYDLELIVGLYLSENGKVDSVVIYKSNLSDFDVQEQLLKEYLLSVKYKCFWNVYYKKQELKPTKMIHVFNPKLIIGNSIQDKTK